MPDPSYIPDPIAEARGRAAASAWNDAISGRSNHGHTNSGQAALEQWQRQCELQSSLPTPPGLEQALANAEKRRAAANG